MRTEAEMYDLILRTAMTDARILAVYMNGSRTNDNAVRDIFQDYDIVYVVEQTRPFIEDAGWIQRFGEILYMQCPEALDLECGIPCNPEENYGWLMQLGTVIAWIFTFRRKFMRQLIFGRTACVGFFWISMGFYLQSVSLRSGII